MKRILAAGAALALALGLSGVPAQAEPVAPASKPVNDLTSAPVETPAQALASGKIKAADLKKAEASIPSARVAGDLNLKGEPPAPKPPSKLAAKAACPTSWCYLYNGGRQDVKADLGTGTPKVSTYRGVSAIVKVGGHQGQLNGATERHSLMELAAQSGPNLENIVEIGATVNPVVNGDYKVTLFSYIWVNGVPTCYNGSTCGNFIKNTAATCQVGVTEFTAGQSVTMTLYYEKSASIKGWWLGCGTEWVGRYADTNWTNAVDENGDPDPQTFETMDTFQGFAEIVSNETTPCSDMGLGLIASNAGAARFGNVRYYATNGTISGTGVNMSTYRIPSVEAGAPYGNTFGEGPAGAQQSYRVGGPMWNAAGTGVGVIGQPC